MSLYDEFIQQGEAEGFAKGFAGGRAKGRAYVLSRQLTLKFGPLPEHIVARIRAAFVDEHRDVFDTWLERVLTAESLDEVFA